MVLAVVVTVSDLARVAGLNVASKSAMSMARGLQGNGYRVRGVRKCRRDTIDRCIRGMRVANVWIDVQLDDTLVKEVEGAK
jgi:hypothetical protein